MRITETEQTCSECYQTIDDDYESYGDLTLCPTCFVEVMGNREKYVRAGEDLPLAEVFNRNEITGLGFIRYLVSVGRFDDDLQLYGG